MGMQHGSRQSLHSSTLSADDDVGLQTVQAAGTFDLLVNIVNQSLSKDSHRKVLSKLLELSYNAGDSLLVNTSAGQVEGERE